MELEVTWSRVIRVWWSYIWRNLIAIIVSMIIGGIVGGIIGVVMGSFGASEEDIKMIAGIAGAIIGLMISIVPMKMILGMNFGEFRLVLLSNENKKDI
ncbi:MAG: hypothetical protein KN64_05755 [Sulfurovum sp. AS07-7]|jgi:hypothetical protein|nr:MAG: hypothetical protein KN64_05755 [Sulfurovum sp. AS07-7]TQV64599.1 MAG: hypothetical protein FNT15_00030 [Sulfurovum sp.]